MAVSRQKQTGFTLIELVMTIVLMGIISVVMGRILFQGYQTFLTSQNISETDWHGFLALERIASDIHNIRSAGDISTIQSNQFTFVDVDGNTVQYQVSGNTLLRNGQTLAGGVQSFSFSYTDENGATTATPSSVRYISLSANLTQGNLTQSFATMSATRDML